MKGNIDMHMTPVGKPTLIAKKGMYTLTIQKGTFHGRIIFMAIVKSMGSHRSGDFKDTFEEAKTEGRQLLKEVHEEGERSFKEFEQQQKVLRRKRFFLNLLPKFLRNIWTKGK